MAGVGGGCPDEKGNGGTRKNSWRLPPLCVSQRSHSPAAELLRACVYARVSPTELVNMLRLLGTALRESSRKIIGSSIATTCIKSSLISSQVRCIAAFAKHLQCKDNLIVQSTGTGILSNSLNKLLVAQPQLPTVPCRTVTKFSLRKGKRKSVKTVLKRFYRLNWGIWIRTIAGRHKRLWKKSAARKRRLRQHVFTNATQSFMLDKMVTKFWRRPKYYPDDPYNPYHSREEFLLTQRKPKPLPEEY